MKQGLTEIVLVCDRSGSMQTIWSDAVGGMKSFIEEQKKVPGEANLTLVMFDEAPFDTVYNRTPIKEVDIKCIDAYSPRGQTALLKAVSDTVDSLGSKIADEKEENRPERVIMVVQTDGQENASNAGWVADQPLQTPDWKPKHPWKEWAEKLNPSYKVQEPPYTKAKLKEKLDYLTKNCKWEVIFLGADSDAFADGASMGATISTQYNNTKGGTRALYDTVSASASSYRTLGMVDNISALNDLKNKK
jgi:hypothetical protein